jgi:hypothetical protein
MELENMDIKEIYESALADPTLFSMIDVDALLAKIEGEENHYLESRVSFIITGPLLDNVTIYKETFEDSFSTSGRSVTFQSDVMPKKGMFTEWFQLSLYNNDDSILSSPLTQSLDGEYSIQLIDPVI